MNETRMTTEHRWAHNEKPVTAKTGRSALTFKGFTAFSYATVVAHKYPKGGGSVEGPVAVFAGDGIWNSGYTQKHKNALRRALPPEWYQITVDLPLAMGSTNRFTPAEELTTKIGLRKIHDWQRKEQLPNLAKSVKNARNYRARARAYEFDLLPALERHNELSAFLKRGTITLARLKVDRMSEEDNVKRAAEARNRPVDMSPKAVAKREKAAELRATEYERGVQKWRDGLSHRCPEPKRRHRGCNNITYHIPVPLRLIKPGHEWRVQTARGVEMPISHALRAYRLSMLAREDIARALIIGAARHIGQFTVTDIQPNGSLRVGCHLLAADEMDKLFAKAKELGALPENWKEAKDETED